MLLGGVSAAGGVCGVEVGLGRNGYKCLQPVLQEPVAVACAAKTGCVYFASAMVGDNLSLRARFEKE